MNLYSSTSLGLQTVHEVYMTLILVEDQFTPHSKIVLNLTFAFHIGNWYPVSMTNKVVIPDNETMRDVSWKQQKTILELVHDGLVNTTLPSNTTYETIMEYAKLLALNYAWVPHVDDYIYGKRCPTCKAPPWQLCTMKRKTGDGNFHETRVNQGLEHQRKDDEQIPRLEDRIYGESYHSVEFPPELNKIYNVDFHMKPSWNGRALESVGHIHFKVEQPDQGYKIFRGLEF